MMLILNKISQAAYIGQIIFRQIEPPPLDVAPLVYGGRYKYLKTLALSGTKNVTINL